MCVCVCQCVYLCVVLPLLRVMGNVLENLTVDTYPYFQQHDSLIFSSHIIRAVHKVCHPIFGRFLPPPPVTHPGTPKSASHISDPRFLVGLVQKTRTKTPCTNSLSIVREGFCPRGFVRGSFVWKVLFGVVFIHFPFCQNTSVTTES